MRKLTPKEQSIVKRLQKQGRIEASLKLSQMRVYKFIEGATTYCLLSVGRNKLFAGKTTFNPKDREAGTLFNYEIGGDIAFGRALKEAY